MPPENNGKKHQSKETGHGWQLTKEKILMWSGLALIGAEFVNAEILGRAFHGDFLLAGTALCGVSLAAKLDKRDK